MATTHDLHRPENNASALWRFAPATGYDTPAQPASEKVKTGLSALWKRVWRGNSQVTVDQENSECPPLAAEILTEVLPEHHYEAAAASLKSYLNHWLHEANPDSLMQAVIGPPGSGVQEIVARWGQQVSARLLLPPDQERLFDPPSDDWQAAARDEEGVLVIPELERFYLRHSDGLDLMRQLAEWLWVSPRRVVVGCDSWAWAYLSKAVKIDAVFSTPIALESLDGDALWTWFRPRPRGRYLVRTAWNGEVVYPVQLEEGAGSANSGAEDKDPPYKGAHLFQKLAAMSRGIPDVALALWRKCLGEGKPEDIQEGRKSGAPLTPIRVLSPESLVLPSIPAGVSTREAIILHTLLLHAGLPLSILSRVVPPCIGRHRDAGRIARRRPG
ncbi:MAG: hypothetical protein FJ271_20145 [Planctomycetes bacterium]|nr:hypothetical protein [Planctomycetota bacterium]